MPIKLNSSLGGSITLNANTASTYTLDLPAVNGTVLTSASPTINAPVITGNVGIGANPATARLQVYDATGATILASGEEGAQITSYRAGANVFGGAIVLQKSRGTVSTPTAALTGDSANISFQAYGGTNFRDVARIRTYASNVTSDTNVSGAIAFETTNQSTATVERARITADGKVGIGTTAPSELLHVANANDTAVLVESTDTTSYSEVLINTNGSDWGIGAGGSGVGATQDRNAFYIYDYTNSRYGIYIGSDGNVGVGTTVATAKLEVEGVIKGRAVGGEGGEIALNNPDNGNVGLYVDVSTADVARIYTVRNNSTINIGQLTGTGGNVGIFTATSERVRVTANGNIGIGTTAPATRFHVDGTFRYTTRPAAGTITAIGYDTNGDIKNSSSSLRYKYDIADYEKGLNIVSQLRPVSFKFNGESRLNIGFIAEEVDALGLNEVMLYDEQNRPDGVLYANMVAILTNAVQEQQAQIDELKAEIAALKGT